MRRITRVKAGDQIGVFSTPPSSTTNLAIHFAGLPNSPDAIPGITEFLLDQEFVVLQPHYPGSHDSGGTFDPARASECAQYWLDAIKHGTVIDIQSGETLPTTLHLALATAHSFGTYTCMQALCQGLQCERAAFFAPMFEFGASARNYGLTLDLAAHGRYVESAYPHTFRICESGAIVRFYTESREHLPLHRASSMTSCALIVGECDQSMNPATSIAGSEEFIDRHADRFRVDEVIRVVGADHSVASMLTPETCAILRAWLNPDSEPPARSSRL